MPDPRLAAVLAAGDAAASPPRELFVEIALHIRYGADETARRALAVLERTLARGRRREDAAIAQLRAILAPGD